jgi:hypothetical protein
LRYVIEEIKLRYVICDNNTGLYWSNDEGWIEGWRLATRFSLKERQTLNLPMGEGRVFWMGL